MKMLSLAAIGAGILSLIVAVVEKLLKFDLLGVNPPNYLHIAATLFLLAVAVMCHDRFYCSNKEQK